MTTDLLDFRGPDIVRAHVRRGERVHTAQLALAGPSWADTEVAIRKFTVRKVKQMLLVEGILCARCGESAEACPLVPCAVCPHARMVLWDDRAEYPITDDMLRVYPPTARFNAIATTAPGRSTAYAAQEFRGAEWIQMPMEERQRVMRGLADRLLLLYPDTDPGTVRTLIVDGKREMPYSANWRAVYADLAG